MDQTESTRRVEPLSYQQVAGLEVWPRLINAMGLAVCLSGLSMIGSGVATLWLYGYLGTPPVVTSGIRLLELLVLIGPTSLVGIVEVFAATAVLAKAPWGLTCMRISLYSVSAGLILMAVARSAILALQIGRTGNTPGILRYQAFSSLIGPLAQLALPLLALAMIRIYRHSLGRPANA